MRDEVLKKAVEEAELACKSLPARKAEVFTAVLVTRLLAATKEGRGAAVLNADSESKSVSIGELFVQKKPRSEPEKGLICAFYLEEVRGVSPFGVDDLQRVFVSAKEKIPGNLNDVMNKGNKKGWIMEHPERKAGRIAWCVTRTGLDTARAGFSRKA
jgi:hypothetical protein